MSDAELAQRLGEAERAVSEAAGQLRAMIRGFRPRNSRNIKAVQRWLAKAQDALGAGQ